MELVTANFFGPCSNAVVVGGLILWSTSYFIGIVVDESAAGDNFYLCHKCKRRCLHLQHHISGHLSSIGKHVLAHDSSISSIMLEFLH